MPADRPDPPQRPDARPPVHVVLEGVDPPVAGLRVQVFDDDLAPQVVVENLTDDSVEVLDDDGRPFLRISATGVAADVHSNGWRSSASPGGAGSAGPPAEPRWRMVRALRAWGWFDSRLARPSSVPAGGVGWAVPLRVGGRRVVIRGQFAQDTRQGTFVARLTSGSELAPHVRVALEPGRPPVLHLENAGPQPVVVLGASDEPFLRIGADGTEANFVSPTWQDLLRFHDAVVAAEAPTGGSPRWERVSPGPRYRWLEPRAGMPSLSRPGQWRPPDNTRSKVKGWQVPVLVGEHALTIQGVVEWVPLPSAQ